MKALFFTLLTISLLFATKHTAHAHPFHVSMCEVKYNSENHTLEIALKIFIDDLNLALSKQDIPDQHYGEKDEKDSADQLLQSYLEKVLQLSVNGEKKQLNFLGKERDGDALWNYIEIEGIDHIKTFEASSTLFFEIYNDQQNIIQLTNEGKTRSLLLQPGNPSDKLSF